MASCLEAFAFLLVLLRFVVAVPLTAPFIFNGIPSFDGTMIKLIPPTRATKSELLSSTTSLPVAIPASTSFISLPTIVVTRATTSVITARPATFTSAVVPSSIHIPHASTLLPTPTYSKPTSPSWALPAQFTNLDCFNITKFASGKQNMQVVQGIPASASVTSLSIMPTNVPAGFHQWKNTTDNAMQLFYPEGSVNPSGDIKGGSDFYATPISMDGVHNVTLQYSVFVDKDFDFVKGGKLPGLYGGHEGCSGGDVATSCFSTRMMWRKDGAGEVYLYVPRDKQPSNLCNTPPQSVCDSVYGLSIGRGSFNFTRGAWTHLMQSVRLNTPGEQDGGFTLDVNGKRILTVEGVFYRDVNHSSRNGKGAAHGAKSKTNSPKTYSSTSSATVSTTYTSTSIIAFPLPSVTAVPPASGPSDPANGGLLGGLFGGLLGGGGLLRRHTAVTPRDGAVLLIAPPSYAAAAAIKDVGVQAPVVGGPVVMSSAEPSPSTTSPMFFSPLGPWWTPTSPVQTTQSPSPSSFISSSSLGPWWTPASPSGNPAATQAPSSATSSTLGPWWTPAAKITTSSSSSSSVPTPTFTSVITTDLPIASSTEEPVPAQIQVTVSEPEDGIANSFGFTGIFFSTFFGGHDDDWASPKDQWMWFKDFSVVVNN